MRILTAIRFNEEIRASLLNDIGRLRPYLTKGKTTPAEQLFLPLVNLGEVDQTGPLKAIMDRITIEPFDLTIGGFGSFKRPIGELIWEGADRCEPLMSLQRQLAIGFTTVGCKVDKAPYQPLITLAKEAALSPSFNKASFTASVPFRTFRVERVSLLRWDRDNGENSYSELYYKILTVSE